MFYLWPSRRSSSAIIHDQKLAKDLAPLLGEEFLKDFVAPALDVNQQSSKQLSELPQSFTYTTVMYTNKKLLARQRLRAAEDLRGPEGHGREAEGEGHPDPAPARRRRVASAVVPVLHGRRPHARRRLGRPGEDRQGQVHRRRLRERAQVLAAMFKDGVIPRTNMQMPYGDGPRLFAAGKAAFFIDGDWRQGAYLTDKSTGKALIDPGEAGDATSRS